MSKGGGGGDNFRPASKEEKRLWALQGDALERMNGLVFGTDENPGYIPVSMGNLGTMANESMDDGPNGLAAKLRGMASTDAMQSGSMGLQAATRGMERFGATMNPNALGAQMNNAGMDMARMRTDAMNKANFGAEDMKWQRNAALAALASGQGNSTVSGLSSLSGQIGQSRMGENNANAQMNANNGVGTGMMVASGLNYLSKADGGYIDRDELHMAGGGLVPFGGQRMGTPEPWKFGGGGGGMGGGGAGVMNMVSPVVAAMSAEKAMKGLGLIESTPLADGLKSGVSYVKDGIKGLGQSVAPMDAASAATLSTGVPVEAMDAASRLALSTGTAEAATAATAASTAATASEIPWFLLALANGGPVGLGRKNMVPGGDVQGPGTATSDSIPARLSDGEYVLNAEAVKMVGKKKLDKMNQAGLQRRAKKGAK